jgi:hypothetical protein
MQLAPGARVVRSRSASLNHPHVGAIYGFEYGDGIRALILEFVDGPTLAERIASGLLYAAVAETSGDVVMVDGLL